MNKILTVLFLLFISTGHAQQHKQTMEQLVAENKGKVILIEYWASWCRPCRALMPASRKLREDYKDKDLVMMYVSLESNITDWAKASEKEKLHLEKYNLWGMRLDGRFDPRKSKVNYIPQYTLIDRKGEIVTYGAPDPSNAKLRRMIDKCLAE